jgi:AcrR family transcriptional regulator
MEENPRVHEGGGMSTGSAARTRGQHAGLRPESIVRTAIAIADEEGLASVSMRRIGARLKVEAMALYHHFPNKDALLDAVVEELSTSAPPLDFAESPWRDALKEYARTQLSTLSEHPNLVDLVMTRPAVTSGNLALLETLVGFLCEAGFSARRGLDMIYTIHELVLMHAALNAEVEKGRQQRRGAISMAANRGGGMSGELRQAAHLEGISEADFPRLVELRAAHRPLASSSHSMRSSQGSTRWPSAIPEAAVRLIGSVRSDQFLLATTTARSRCCQCACGVSPPRRARSAVHRGSWECRRSSRWA